MEEIGKHVAITYLQIWIIDSDDVMNIAKNDLEVGKLLKKILKLSIEKLG